MIGGDPMNELFAPLPGIPVGTLAGIADAMREGLQLLSPELRYLYLNEAAAAEHGRSSKRKLIGRTLLECYPGVRGTRLFEELSSCIVEGRERRFDHCFDYGDGSSRWFRLLLHPVPVGVVVLSLDIEHEKRLEAALSAARPFEVLGRSTGGVAHDLNNLLTVIQTGCAILQTGAAPSADEVRREVAHIHAASERSAQLMRQLLDVGRKVARDRRVHVGTALKEIQPLLRRLLGKAMELHVTFGTDVGHVQIHPTEFDRVLLNLVSNARDAAEDGGHAYVSAERIVVDDPESPLVKLGLSVGQYVAVHVADDGSGMDAETLSRVFEPFFSTKDAGRGTGLGLATSQRIIMRAGGLITAHSTPGQGSAFEVYLPCI